MPYRITITTHQGDYRDRRSVDVPDLKAESVRVAFDAAPYNYTPNTLGSDWDDKVAALAFDLLNDGHGEVGWTIFEAERVDDYCEDCGSTPDEPAHDGQIGDEYDESDPYAIAPHPFRSHFGEA